MCTNDGKAFSVRMSVKLTEKSWNVRIVILALMHVDDLLPIADFK